MKPGLASDSLGGLPLGEMLGHAARVGLSGVEANTGGWSTAPHLDLRALKGGAEARRSVLDAFASRRHETSVALLKGAMPAPAGDHGPQGT